MSDYLSKLFTDQVVRSLPERQREIYTYVIELEDELAETVTTKEAFIDRLQYEKPHVMAASRFNMTLFELLQILKQTEEEIAHKLERMERSVAWHDCTSILKQSGMDVQENKRIFFLSLPNAKTI